MRMKVICGDPDCREEFFVDSKDRIWVCPNCSREIENKHYPFLTARFMQARIDKESADWKKRLSELIEEARKEISERSDGDGMDLSFLDEMESKLNLDLKNDEYRRLHDRLMEKARKIVIELDG